MDRKDKRVTIGLTARVTRSMAELEELTGESMTELVNEAIPLLLLHRTAERDGRELFFRNPDGTTERIILL